MHLGSEISQALTSLHIEILQWIQEESSYPWAQGGRKSLPLALVVPGRRVFSLFLVLAALGVVHQMLCEPWFKAGKDRFFWHLTEMTPKSRGGGVFPEVGLAGWREEKSK